MNYEPGNPDFVGYGYEGEFENEPYNDWWSEIDADPEWIAATEWKDGDIFV